MGDHKSQASSLVEAFNNSDWDASSRLFGSSTYNEFGTQRSLKGADIIVESSKWYGFDRITWVDDSTPID